MKRKPLTQRQRDILIFIKKFSKNEGYPPTYYEIADSFKITLGTVQDHLNALIKKGYLRRSNKARDLKLI